MSLVSLVRVDGSNNASFKKAIEKSLDLIQFNFEVKVRKVVIKPNLCYYYDYSTGETTDPRFVSALIDVLRERLSADPEISIVESDASAMKCRHAFRMLGYAKMAKEKEVALVNLSQEKNQTVELRLGERNLNFHIPQIIREADFLVNVPKIKYQSGVKITCALKNIYGCNAYPKKFVYHRVLDEAIVNLNKLIRSDLVVVDGIIAAGTKTSRLGLVMASKDPVAIDAAASEIMGVDPKSVRQIQLASQEGLGSMQFIQKGESLTYFRDLFPRRRVKDKIRMLLSAAYLRYFR